MNLNFQHCSYITTSWSSIPLLFTCIFIFFYARIQITFQKEDHFILTVVSEENQNIIINGHFSNEPMKFDCHLHGLVKIHVTNRIISFVTFTVHEYDRTHSGSHFPEFVLIKTFVTLMLAVRSSVTVTKFLQTEVLFFQSTSLLHNLVFHC